MYNAHNVSISDYIPLKQDHSLLSNDYNYLSINHSFIGNKNIAENLSFSVISLSFEPRLKKTGIIYSPPFPF